MSLLHEQPLPFEPAPTSDDLRHVETFHVIGGTCSLTMSGVMQFKAYPGPSGVNAYVTLSKYDAAELLKRSCGSLSELFSVLAFVCTRGHRFTTEDEEAF